MLELKDLHVNYGAVHALNGVSMTVNDGEIVSLIGANGAGKTTTLRTITGLEKAASGSITFDGHDLRKTEPSKIITLKLAHVPEGRHIFPQMTVEENLELALKNDKSVWGSLRARLSGEQRDRIDEVLALLRLGNERARRAGLLSHGQKQFLEIGMLLVQEPHLLLLDEPAAGMTDAETEYTAELFRQLAGKHSLMVVEHDMGFVETIADRVTVLHQGRVLAQGSLREVQANEQVIEVYLGR